MSLLAEAVLREAPRILQDVDDVWSLEPVAFPEFVTSQDHLKLPSLSERQYHDVMTFLGPDPKRIFPRTVQEAGTIYNLFVMLVGKGGGKDYIASLVVTYIYYLLLCLKDPQEYFNFAAGEPIEIMIVSYSEKQTINISFEKIKQRFKRWRWLHRRYSVFWGEKYISKPGNPEVHVMREMISSYNSLRIITGHSMNEGYEGYSPLFWVMSEASAFKTKTQERNGDKVFSTLKSSASSRFPGRWRGMVMSFPRNSKQEDFTYKLYESTHKAGTIEAGKEGDQKARVYAIKAATWEYKPARFYSGNTFEYKGVQVPTEHQEEAESDEDEFDAKFRCEPREQGAPLASDDLIIRAVHDHPPLVVFENVIQDGLVTMRVHGFDPKKFVHDTLITVDLSEVSAATGIALQHFDWRRGYVLDAIGAWTPDSKAGVKVDLDNVRTVLLWLGRQIPRVRIFFDQWQSRLMRIDLKQSNIRTGEYHTYDRDYRDFLKGMALGNVHIVHDVPFITQIKALRNVTRRNADGMTVEHVVLDQKASKRKDMLDVAVGGFKILLESAKPAGAWDDGIAISSNLADYGTLIEDAP